MGLHRYVLPIPMDFTLGTQTQVGSLESAFSAIEAAAGSDTKYPSALPCRRSETISSRWCRCSLMHPEPNLPCCSEAPRFQNWTPLGIWGGCALRQCCGSGSFGESADGMAWRPGRAHYEMHSALFCATSADLGTHTGAFSPWCRHPQQNRFLKHGG